MSVVLTITLLYCVWFSFPWGTPYASSEKELCIIPLPSLYFSVPTPHHLEWQRAYTILHMLEKTRNKHAIGKSMSGFFYKYSRLLLWIQNATKGYIVHKKIKDNSASVFLGRFHALVPMWDLVKTLAFLPSNKESKWLGKLIKSGVINGMKKLNRCMSACLLLK